MDTAERKAPVPLVLTGCGAVSQFFYASAIQALAPMGLVTLRALVDPCAANRAALAKRFPDASQNEHLEDVKLAPEDLVIVATPPRFHSPLAIHALRAGASVLVEKPAACTMAEARAMVTEEERSSGFLAIGHVRRFYASTQMLRELILSGILGKLQWFEIEESAGGWNAMSDSFFRPEVSGGGVFLDVGIHILDQLDSWLGDPLEVEYADDAMGGVEANAVCRLRYATGSEGVIRLSKERKLANRHQFDFEKGVVCWRVGKPDTLEIQVAGTAASLAGTLLQNGVLPSGTDPQCFIEQLRHVVAVKSGQAARLLIPSSQALRALAVVEKAYKRKTLLKMAWLGAEEQTRAMRLAGPRSPQTGDEGGRPTDLIEGRKAIPWVAITGASGFVGSRLVESMHLGDWPFHIAPFVRGPNSLARLARLALKFRTADLFDLESTTHALQNCDLLVHAALGDPGQIVRMAEVLSRACARAGVKRVVVISTAAVFGLVAPENSDDHAEPRPPKNEPYALAKLQAERIFQAAAVRHGFELIILRPSLVYGPRSARMEGLWQGVRKGISGIVDEGRGVFNGIYVDNLVEAVRLALSAKVKSGSFYIGDQEQPHWADVYAALGVNVADLPSIEPPQPHGPSLLERAQSCSANPAVQRLLPWFPGRLKSVTKRVLAALPEKALPNAWVPAPMAPALEIDEELARLQTTRWRFSSANAEELLGYKPVISFGEGMRLTREWLEFSSL